MTGGWLRHTFTRRQGPEEGVRLEFSLALCACADCHGRNERGDGHMQAEGHAAVREVLQPDAGVQGDDLGTAHQDDVHDDRHAVVLGRGMHEVAVLAHHAHSHILHM